ncbi:MAG: DUF1631 domain-containing protein [Gammaproteobacteria bacterium]|nr:DUF1631 domain-containing protein [Gammaproteobacteria bacterium]
MQEEASTIEPPVESSVLKDPEHVKNVINRFINGESEGSDNRASMAQAASGGKQFHDRRDIIKALTQLQLSYKPEYTPGEEININNDDFKRALLNSMAKIGNASITKSLNEIDGKTIDFIEMIFGAFLRDQNISDAMKSLLLSLQVPLIKVAMLDKKLFSQEKHPARYVLDTIAHIGIGIDDKESTLYKTMELIADQLLNNFDQNIASFNNALNALSRLRTIEQKKHDQKEAETQKQIIKEHARQLVLSKLQQQTKNKDIPNAIKPLILKQWSTLMFYHYVKEGSDSEQWNEAIELLKQLVQSVQPIKSKDQWNWLSNNATSLVEKIKEQLYATQLDKDSVDTSIQMLAKAHQQRLSEINFDDIEEAILDEEPDLDDIIDEGPEIEQPQTASPREQLARLPGEVKQGVWFEVFNGEERAVRRLKLSVLLFEEAKLIFVDRVGDKVLEKDALTFKDELDNGQSRIIADHSVFNHALGQVIASLSA